MSQLKKETDNTETCGRYKIETIEKANEGIKISKSLKKY